ncbi:flagellar motor switch protein FliG [Mariprofundus ferrinatatus]|uniref:Flagellar motor switch protein FliG n=1 Tax=Mariprofundus ferrinatatus TaxID=1921087 RepID=A0A2K8L6H1_9PROT|nr:flagellar motor switch protein FliG [Mariprofundus ferrinatatus]ATX82918.1 flagellar motor switch protein FliG [Mariprofundus ferrinatatus]
MSKGANNRVISGLDRAAIFLLSVGPEVAAGVLRHIDDQGLVELAKRMPQIKEVSAQTIEEIYTEFIQMHRSGDAFVPSSALDIHELLRDVVEPERLQRIMESLEDGGPIRMPVWEKLARMDPGTIFNLIKDESAQTTAVILGRLESEKASAVIQLFPQDKQMAVVIRMARIERIKGDVTRDIEAALDEQVNRHQGGGSGLAMNGMDQVVEILKTLDGKSSKFILDNLKEHDQGLYEQVDSQLLMFEDFTDLDGRDIQAILKNVQSEDLMRALKGASDELREHFFSNMSSRAADIMREDIDAMGGLKVSDVEKAQRAILDVARTLDSEGVISLGTQEDMVY